MKQWVFMVVLCTLAPPTEAAADAARRAHTLPQPGERAVAAVQAVTEFLPNGDFEQGPAIWSYVPESGLGGIWSADRLTVAPHGGNWLAMLGFDDPTYEQYIEQMVTVPAGSPTLNVWYLMRSTTTCGSANNWFGIQVDSIVDDYFFIEVCIGAVNPSWELITLPMAGWAGQTVNIRMRLRKLQVGPDRLYLDDIFFEFDAPVETILEDGFESKTPL